MPLTNLKSYPAKGLRWLAMILPQNMPQLALVVFCSSFLFIPSFNFAQGAGCTITISGNDSGTYTVNAGDKLCIAPTGFFNGTVNVYGGIIENNATAAQSFTIAFDTGYPDGKIINYGTINLPAWWSLRENNTLDNYGTINQIGAFEHNTTSIFNNYGTFLTDNYTLSGNAVMHNYGTIDIFSTLRVNLTGTFNNYAGAHVECDDLLVSQLLNNNGAIEVADVTFIYSSAEMVNDGGCLTTYDLTMQGELSGISCGTITIANESSINNSGAVISGNIAIVDQTPPGSAPFVDTNSGTISPTVTWSSCGCPGAAPVENCSDGLDNDMDCLVDCEDPDCGVSVLEREINEPLIFAVGQEDFTSDLFGPTTDSTFRGAMDVHQDPTTGKVFVADENNHRILRYATVEDFILNKPAEAVIGQSNFTSRASGITSTNLNSPRSIFVDNSGTLWVADYYGARVLRFDNASTILSGASADGVLGQANFATREFATTRARMKYPTHVYVDDLGALWVTEFRRILRFDNAAGKNNGANANAVFGQSTYNASVFGTSQEKFGKACEVVKICDRLYVADSSGDRIVWFDSPNTLGNGPLMDGVIGQLDYTASSNGLSQNQFYSPINLAVDEENTLYVVDQLNNRVVTIKDITTKSFMTDFETVWNQADFTSNVIGTSATRGYALQGIAILKSVNTTYIATADFDNNRIEIRGNNIFTDESTDISSTLPGQDVAGTGSITFAVTNQPTMGTITIDNSTTGAYSYTAPGTNMLTEDSLITFDYSITNGNSCMKNGSIGIVLSPGAPLIEICHDNIDNDNDGLMDCDDNDCGVSVLHRTIGEAAQFVVGQNDFTSTVSGISNTLLNGPYYMDQDPTTGKIFVTDQFNHRVLRYKDLQSFLLNEGAEAVFGAPDMVTDVTTTTATTIGSIYGLDVDYAGRLWVVDRTGHRVLRFDNASTKPSGAAADGVLGQTNFTDSGFGISATTMGLNIDVLADDNGTVWVSDSKRILRFDNAAAKTNGTAADGVLGQANFTASSSTINQMTLNGPRGMAMANGRLYVADMSANRVVYWDDAQNKADGAAMDGVIGQSNFTSSSGTTSNQKFEFPVGLHIDEKNTLYVGQTLSNRVVVIEDVLSKSFLTPFDAVIGQPDFTTWTSGTTASKGGQVFDIDVFYDGDIKYLCTTQHSNNRIMAYGMPLIEATEAGASTSSTLIGTDMAGSGGIGFYMDTQPSMGTITIDDEVTGAFTYTPPANCTLTKDTVLTYTYFAENLNDCSELSGGYIKLSPAFCNELNCDDGLDNDSDGLIDCADPNCAGNTICPDSDGDGVLDGIDIDDDNDGILDEVENNFCTSTVKSICFSDDFGQGSATNSPFVTDYCFEDGSTSNAGCGDNNIAISDSEYVVASSTQPYGIFYPDWTSGPDNTGNTDGRMLVVGSNNPSNEVYRRNLSNLIKHSTLQLEFSVRNNILPGYNLILPEVRVEFQDGLGNILGTYFTGTIPEDDTWHDFSFSFDPGTESIINIVLFGNSVAGNGNDFAIDDIIATQTLCDSDGDGVSDHLDLDSDNDGIYDVLEAGSPSSDGDYNGIIGTGNSSAIIDSDNDGLSDIVDPDNGGTPLPGFDLDMDNLQNRVDLDSDGDGCSDLLEAGFQDGNLDQMVGPNLKTIDQNGLVTNSGDGFTAPNQTNSGVFDGTDPNIQTGCPDNDSDLIMDGNDLDDDNDGILDTVEYDCSTNSDDIVRWLSNGTNQSGGEIRDANIVDSETDLVFGSGLGGSFGNSYILMSGMDSPNLQTALLDDDYIQYTFTTQPDINAVYLEEFTHLKLPIDLPEIHADSYGYDVATIISKNNFSTFKILNDRHTIDDVMPSGIQTSDIPIVYDNFYYLEPSTQYSIRLVFYNRTTDASTNALLDDFVIHAFECNSDLDMDTDNTPNHADSDSDGDGCNDVIEAGFPDGDGDGKLGGIVPPTIDLDGKVTSGGM